MCRIYAGTELKTRYVELYNLVRGPATRKDFFFGRYADAIAQAVHIFSQFCSRFSIFDLIGVVIIKSDSNAAENGLFPSDQVVISG